MTAQGLSRPGTGPAAFRQASVVNRYVAAAIEILVHETRSSVERGPIAVEANPYTTEEVTAVVGISGDVSGSLYLSMSEATALGIVGTMLGQPVQELDEIARSGIAELANVVAGTAGMALAADGLSTNIAPPLLLHGAGARLSTVHLQRLVVSLQTRLGSVAVHVAVRDPRTSS